jgi:glycosyltransferase involved in cell wall biosynthesis
MNPRLIVISFSSLTAINRKVYTILAEQYDLRLIIPASVTLGTFVKEAEPATNGDPSLLLLPLVGENPRIQYYKGIWKAIKKFKPDYIFIENDPISLLSSICCLYKLIWGARILCQTNENLSLSLKGFFLKGSFRAKALLLFKRTTCFFTRPFIDQVFSINYEGKLIFENLSYKRVSWIPLGYSPNIFYRNEHARNKIRQELKLESTIVGYFGRIVPQKGLLLLLKALCDLREYSWKLMIDDFSAYKTPYIEEIREFINENRLEGQVIFFHADHEEIAGYMNACDLVVVPSITEGSFKEQYGRVVQEAIACSCLTITSDSGFLPNFFQNEVFVFRENDVEAIKEKIRYFLDMDTKSKMGLMESAINYIKNNFSIDAQAKVVSNALAQLK